MPESKRTVKKIYSTDNYCLIRAIVIAIAYREKIKERFDMLKRPTNKKLLAEVHKAAKACNIINRHTNHDDIAELEKYFVKYRIILLDENYIESEKVLYVNPDYTKFEKNIYLQLSGDHFNVIDSIKAFCGKYYFCEYCIDIFSYACDHCPCPIKSAKLDAAHQIK